MTTTNSAVLFVYINVLPTLAETNIL